MSHVVIQTDLQEERHFQERDLDQGVRNRPGRWQQWKGLEQVYHRLPLWQGNFK